MPIPVTGGEGPSHDGRPGRRHRRRWLTLLAVGQLFITLPVIAIAILMLGQFRYQEPPLEKIGPWLAAVEMAESVRNYRFPVRHWLGLSDEFPTLYLDIKQKDYRVLEYCARNDLAVEAGSEGDILRREVDVPAHIRLADESLRVKIRLKGDRPIHYAYPDRWSFRVEVRGEKTLFGMKSFSLQKPITRNYLYEWFFHEVLRHEGLIGLRYQFVNLHVNGKSQGLYALEEHFEKRLLEANQRREAPILKFEEPESGFGDSWHAMAVVPYSARRWAERNPQMLQQAVYLLEGFRDGRLALPEVFDVALLARYFALIDLTETFHGALAKSVKFYYNPVSAKLEPIGFDAHYYGRKFPVLSAELSDFRDPVGYSMPAWHDALFGPDIRDKIGFYEAYVRELERVSQPEFLDRLFADIGPELEANLDFIYAEVPFVDMVAGHPRTTGASPFFYFAKHKFYDRQVFLRNRLKPHAAVTAYIESVDRDRIVLQLGNAQKLPIEIVDVVHAGRVYRSAERLLLDEKPRYSPIAFHRVELVAVADAAPPPEKQKNEVVLEPLASAIRYRVPGATWVGERPLFPWTLAAAEMPAPERYNRFVAVPEREFLSIDAAGRTLAIRPGHWALDADLVIPAGWTLRGGAGTVLDLRAASRIVSYSPLLIAATELDPFVVTSSDRTGRGLMVIDAEGRSSLRHVRFEQLSLPEDSSWKITSVVTFHRSDVTLESCAFVENRSEDALNIIQSNFEVRGARFEGTASDAFDSDFSNGRVEDSQFVRIGNDAIDVSGSQVTVRNVQIANAGDKGISVGEASRLEAEFVSITGANIGVAVKDASNFDGMTLDIRDAAVGFALFQKKPEFGPAKAEVWRASLSGVKESHWLERGSELLYDGAPVASNREDLRKVLYPDEFAQDAK